MKYKILIVGAGQLGSRYLQGLSNCYLDLHITVVDSSADSLERASSRWDEVSEKSVREHEVSFFSSMPEYGAFFDLLIIATSASGRAKLILECTELFDIRYLIIEKVLAQSSSELDMIDDALYGRVGVWVNTPRRISKWYQQLRSVFVIQEPVNCSVIGGDWGLACNSIHFLDLMAWCTGKDLVRVDTGLLASAWHESKRSGYFEVYGELMAYYADGSTLKLISKEKHEAVMISLQCGGVEWQISESVGTAVNSDGKAFSGKLEFQSELTGPLVESILQTGTCGLPTLHESLGVHKPFILSMVDHWNSTMTEKRTEVPLT